MYRKSTDTPWYALTFAVISGTLFAIGHWIPAVVLAVVAIVIYWLHILYDQGKDRSGLYP